MATPAFADSDGSWTTLSYLRHVFDQFDVRFPPDIYVTWGPLRPCDSFTFALATSMMQRKSNHHVDPSSFVHVPVCGC